MSYASASILAERLNVKLIMGFASYRARVGVGFGERAPVAPARGPMEVCEVTAGAGDGEGCAVTEPGLRTTRRRLPQVLSRMAGADARRAAAMAYAQAVEQIGSMAGASAEGVRADGGAATNDGGVTTRIKHAATISTVEGVLNRAGPALVPGNRRGGGHRRAISCRALIDALCVEGSDMKAILTGAGWSGQRRDVRALSEVAEACLEEMARALDLIPTNASAPLRLAVIARGQSVRPSV